MKNNRQGDLYEINVSIYSGGRIFHYKERVLVKNNNLAQGIVIDKNRALRKFWNKFPAHNIEKIEIEKPKYITATNIPSTSKSKKERVLKLPFPRSNSKCYEILQRDGLGRRTIRYVYQKRELYLTVLKGERISCQDGRLIIASSNPTYIKIIGNDTEGIPVLITWTPSDLQKKKGWPFLQYLWQVNSPVNFLPLEEYRATKRIAFRKLKKKLKGGERK